MIEKDKFLRPYKDTDHREKINEFWPDLEAIYDDYSSRKPTLTLAMNLVQESLRNTREVHSTRVRLKDAEHLVEKCVRKRLEDPSRIIDLSTYMNEITDLVGVRALHLFKSDWKPIHKAITETWDLKELPTANIRKGDSEKLVASYTEHGCSIKEHPFGYRSVHYLANTHPTKQSIVVEIQVRTLFEEAWSEIDHSVRYPYGSPPAIAAFLEVFNRLAGSADEMGSFVQDLQDVMRAMEVQHDQQVTVLNRKIRNLEEQVNNSRIAPTEKTEILHQVKAVSSAARSPSSFSWTDLFRALASIGEPGRPVAKPNPVAEQWIVIKPPAETERHSSSQAVTQARESVASPHEESSVSVVKSAEAPSRATARPEEGTIPANAHTAKETVVESLGVAEKSSPKAARVIREPQPSDPHSDTRGAGKQTKSTPRARRK